MHTKANAGEQEGRRNKDERREAEGERERRAKGNKFACRSVRLSCVCVLSTLIQVRGERKRKSSEANTTTVRTQHDKYKMDRKIHRGKERERK